MNYFDEANQSRFHQQIRDMRDEYEERFKKWFGIIGGYGPEIKDWRII
jgi:hypothetical protein